ncbi:MAG: HAD family hydrolase [Candidatus Woesearchaeota archaeon]|jgi:HAD superfamily phosphatase|nr:HAD family hydrolase [Candidatus Woesearchaeota archaeon]|tara:strand:- start:117 stop:782 length:666 start_codon:yes stop_codon:yes gene_type:complete
MKQLIIFDVDGVLIDVSRSFRVATKKTVEFFLEKKIDMKEVYQQKLKTGFNDDFDCTDAILKKHKKRIKRKEIIKKFEEYYLGRNFNGLIRKEKLLLKTSVIKKLAKNNTLAIFTGRSKKELSFTLKHYKLKKYFKKIITVDDVKKKKPNPEGIKKIINSVKPKKTFYVGDSIDDFNASKKAKIPFIGVIPPYGDKKKLRKVFKSADHTISNINNIIKVVK